MIIHECEQNSNAWLALRCGKLTSSGASKIVTSTGAASKSLDDYAEMLAGELYAGGMIDDFAGNAYTERGHELEDEALDYYAFVTGNEVEKVGFVTTDDESEGSSPDGLVGTDGMVEVKCLSYKAHIKAIMYITSKNRIPPTYVQQKQHQMLVCERKWNDSIFYHPSLPSIIHRDVPDTDIVFGLITQKAKLIQARDIVLEILKAA